MAKREEITPFDIPALLESLECGDAEEQQQTLRRLCPCRSRSYDPEIWTMIYRTYTSMEPERVRHQAKHAIDTLLDRSAQDPCARDLLDTLAERGIHLRMTADPQKRPRDERLRPGDLPRLLDILAGEDAEAKVHALRLLCPCRNRCYDTRVWLAILTAHEQGSQVNVRDQAAHAIQTLRERAAVDPRSRELLLALAAEGAMIAPAPPRMPRWNRDLTRGKAGLHVRRNKGAQRSKANRPR